MKTNTSKGLKPFISKVLIICMSVLYIFSPVHVEVNMLLHEIVHGLKMPDYVLSHKKVSRHYSNTIKIHESDQHQRITGHHNHEIIELVEKILESVNQGSNTSDSQIISHKIDKHINNRQYDDQKKNVIVLLEMTNCFSETKKRIHKGYLQNFREPPRA